MNSRGKSGLHRIRIPAKGWGPRGYGKYNRKQPDHYEIFHNRYRMKMSVLGIDLTFEKKQSYKPYPKQDRKGYYTVDPQRTFQEFA